jgi:FtsZ-binding cell division protein ZapB
VEGVLGLEFPKAMAQLEKLRIEHNLGFKIEAVQFENDIKKVVPTKPIRFPDLDVLFRHYREELSSNLELVKNYNQSLGEALTGVAEKTFENVRDPDGTEAFTNIKSAVQDNSQLFVNKIDSVFAKMYRPLANFQEDFAGFRKEYNDVALIGHSIDKKVAFSKQASVASPIDKLVLDNSFKKFDQLVDLFENRKTKVLKQYIFDQFFNKNPGLKYSGGVPEGGTLVLVYSDGKIVADFCLPYCCSVAVEEEDDHTKPVVPTIPGIVFQPSVIPTQPKPFKWLEKFDVVKDPHLTTRFKGIDEGVANLDILKSKLGVFENKLPEWESKFSVWDKAKADFEGKLDFWERNKINIWEGRVNSWEANKINVWDSKFSKLITTTPTTPTPDFDLGGLLDRVGVLENERVVVNDKISNLENVQLADFRRQLDIKADKAVVDARLLGIEGKTNELTVKTTKLDTNVASFGAKVNTLENSVNAVDNKFTVFDNRIRGIEGKVTVFDTRFTAIDTNVAGLKTNLEGRLTTLSTQVATNKADVDSRLTTIRTDVTRLNRPIQ